MVGIKNHEVQFSLKDMLFNREKVTIVGCEIKKVYKSFEQKKFEKKAVGKFPELELMERVMWIRDCLSEFLPNDYRESVKIILKSLPPELDPNKTDKDFGIFIYAPYAYFVAENGCTKKDLKFSLKALKELTKRFSVEGPIRFFLNEFPNETIAELKKWSKDKNYHVRRLASEGTRPFLPWAQKIHINPKDVLPILEKLYSDSTRYVTRSLANHMNDLSKIEPKLVVVLLKKWKKSKKQKKEEMQYIINHSLRTLVKQGNEDALKLLGFEMPKIKVENFKIKSKKVKIGDILEFSFDVSSTSKEKQNLVLDYVVHFLKSNGKHAPKTHKIRKITLKPNEKVNIIKKHPLKLMSTRTLYLGIHSVELQINGQSYGRQDFELV